MKPSAVVGSFEKEAQRTKPSMNLKQMECQEIGHERKKRDGGDDGKAPCSMSVLMVQTTVCC